MGPGTAGQAMGPGSGMKGGVCIYLGGARRSFHYKLKAWEPGCRSRKPRGGRGRALSLFLGCGPLPSLWEYLVYLRFLLFISSCSLCSCSQLEGSSGTKAGSSLRRSFSFLWAMTGKAKVRPSIVPPSSLQPLPFLLPVSPWYTVSPWQ